MLLRLTTLALAQALDLWTFATMVARHGIGTEANPLAVDLFHSLGLPALLLGKVALVIAIGALAVAGADGTGRGVATGRGTRAWAVVGGLPLALAITAGLVGSITNTAWILR